MNSGHLPKPRFLCPKARIIHADMKSTPRTQSVSQGKAVRVVSAALVGWTNRFMIAAYSAGLMTTTWQAIKFNRIYNSQV